MKTGNDLHSLALYLFNQTKGDKFDFMLKVEAQPEFANLTEQQRDMIFSFCKEVSAK